MSSYFAYVASYILALPILKAFIYYISGSQTFFVATSLQKYAELATPQS